MAKATNKAIIFMPAKSDVIFKLFFGDERNRGFLIMFLQSVLRLPLDEYIDIQISDPHLKREYPGDKLAILDVRVKTKTGKWINVEIQLQISPEMRERIVLYTSKMTAAQIGSGDGYDTIKQVITIVITGEVLIEEHNVYHDIFTYYSPNTKTQFTDLTEIHTLELPKLPKESDGTDLYDWLGFINADSEEELAVLAQKSPQMEAPIEKLLELNQDVEARMLFEAREKQRRDDISRERRARMEGLKAGQEAGHKAGHKAGQEAARKDVARNLFGLKLPIDDIVKATGLSRKEVEDLNKAH